VISSSELGIPRCNTEGWGGGLTGVDRAYRDCKKQWVCYFPEAMGGICWLTGCFVDGGAC
jgi:hypothetical protein